MTFTSVNREKLQKAFALAHKASENCDTPKSERLKFQLIARLLWEAHGEQGAPPEGSGQELLEKMRSHHAA
jgi:hypothetical protein